MPSDPLLIFGASARAAAFSALRAGLQPWCADLFADADLHARCAVTRLPGSEYPRGFLRLIQQEIPGPWMYAGGLENHPALIEEMARLRPLWGNDAAAVRCARNPIVIAQLLATANLPHPAVYGTEKWSVGAGSPRSRWVIKPLAGAGGRGIHFLGGSPARSYIQEYIAGQPCSAIYFGRPPEKTILVGVSLQLVGQDWLHAAPFHYCGSVGPLPLAANVQQTFEQIGDQLAQGCHLRGLFGIDAVLREGVPYPIEVNPRYTASVEVLEYATRRPLLALHRRAFEPDAFLPKTSPLAWQPTVGKAILFARAPLTFPDDGPWMTTLRQPGDIWELPAFADIPAAGTRFEAGQPILSFFARRFHRWMCRGVAAGSG